MTCSADCAQGARAAFHIAQGRMLIAALEEMFEIATPLPPRRLSSRETTALQSLKVAKAELDSALALLTAKPNSHTTRGISHVASHER
jgi:hypothetical protein